MRLFASSGPTESSSTKNTNDLTTEEWSTQDLRDLAQEAFAAGDEAQAALVAIELRARGDLAGAADIDGILDRRNGRARFCAVERAFSGKPRREHLFLVEGDVVRVWDEAAGYFTRCHSLSTAARRRLLATAAELA